MIKIAELEKAMFRKLDETVIRERDRTFAIVISTINFLTPLLCICIIIIPLLFSLLQFINITIASWISVGLALSILFVAGAYLGKLTKGNPFIKGLRMVVFGGVAFTIGFFIQMLL